MAPTNQMLERQAPKSPNLEKKAEAQQYDKYVGMVKASGYNLDESVGNVNVIGIRGWMDGNAVENETGKGTYNDTIVCVYQSSDDKGNVTKYCAEFIASVDPGSFKPGKKDNPNGIANLIGGQYTYQKGSHPYTEKYTIRKKGKKNQTVTKKGRYEAYNPVGASVVWRDKNNDGNQDKADMSRDTGNFGINIHAAGDYQGQVGTWSKGCQVIASKDGTVGRKNTEFQRFREIINKHDQDKKFVYTLLHGKTAWDAYQLVAATAKK